MVILATYLVSFIADNTKTKQQRVSKKKTLKSSQTLNLVLLNFGQMLLLAN